MRISGRTTILVCLLIVLAIVLRLYPGKDHLLWNTSDYARDAYTMRSMVEQRDVRLLGARSEVFDPIKQAYLVFTGPLYYYILSPWYYLSAGDPNLPLLVNIVIHTFTMAPLAWLSWKIWRRKTAVILTMFLFAVSYEQIEYARWLLNPAMALPFLAWFWLWLYEFFTSRQKILLAGLFLGLAIQSEIFLLYWLVPVAIILLMTKSRWTVWVKFGLGWLLGLLPLVIAELKFNFRSSLSLINYLLNPTNQTTSLMEKIGRYGLHLQVVMAHNFSGWLSNWNLLLLVIILVLPLFYFKKINQRLKHALIFLYILFFAQALIFLFNFQESIYADVGLGLILILLFVMGQFCLLQQHKKWLSWLLIGGVALAQLLLLERNVRLQTPFSRQFFAASDTLLFSHRLSVVEKIYQLSNGQDFSISILDVPYGWPATWASVFEQYAKRHQRNLPTLYGFSVNEVPGDKVFTKTDAPAKIHFVLTPQSSALDEQTRQNFFILQDQVSTVETKYYLHNLIIEKRYAK